MSSAITNTGRERERKKRSKCRGWVLVYGRVGRVRRGRLSLIISLRKLKPLLTMCTSPPLQHHTARQHVNGFIISIMRWYFFFFLFFPPPCSSPYSALYIGLFFSPIITPSSLHPRRQPATHAIPWFRSPAGFPFTSSLPLSSPRIAVLQCFVSALESFRMWQTAVIQLSVSAASTV
jgi:hypothetical protein